MDVWVGEKDRRLPTSKIGAMGFGAEVADRATD